MIEEIKIRIKENDVPPFVKQLQYTPSKKTELKFSFPSSKRQTSELISKKFYKHISLI